MPRAPRNPVAALVAEYGGNPANPDVTVDQARFASNLGSDELGVTPVDEAVPFQALSPNHLVEVYQRPPDIDPAENVFVRDRVLYGSLKAAMLNRDADGKQTHFTRKQLDLEFPGWRLQDPADSPYKCPAFNCRKRLPDAQRLASHVEGFHESLFKAIEPQLKVLLRKEGKARLNQSMVEAAARMGVSKEELEAEVEQDAKVASPA